MQQVVDRQRVGHRGPTRFPDSHQLPEPNDRAFPCSLLLELRCGPVLSRDGKKLVWRANHPTTPATQKKYHDLLSENLTSPMKMELFVADSDGKSARQITNFGCASFAPTFTPDGKKILFSSNKHNCDGRKFELFLCNLDGSGLEQVTDFGGFTAFPEFSPDGKNIVFASDRNAKERYEFNIFTAEWK